MNAQHRVLKTLTIMYKFTFILLLITGPLMAQQQTDTFKCYVQIMVPASGTIGLSKEIEDNRVFFNGGIFLYTKAYAIKDSTGKYTKFLTPRKKELKDIWWPEIGPVVMRKEW